MVIQTATLGYARMGKNREVKKALESFWHGKCEINALRSTVEAVETHAWTVQLKAGVDRIAVGDQTLYDHVLDWSVRLGLIPARFRQFTGIDQYFAMARGKDGIPALEMTKWFDTNYHYLVPEIESDLVPTANFDDFLATVKRAQLILSDRATPVILSPITLLTLSRRSNDLYSDLDRLLPLYLDLLGQLKSLGITEVQFHEPT